MAATGVIRCACRHGGDRDGAELSGETQHLSAELFKSMAGIDVVIVPFNNTGAVIAAEIAKWKAVIERAKIERQ